MRDSHSPSLLSFLFTGLLGGFGVFRTDRGYVTGAGAILLIMFGVLYAAKQIDQQDKISDLEGEIFDFEKIISKRDVSIETLNANILSKDDVIETKKTLIALLNARLLQPVAAKLYIRCSQNPSSTDFFSMADASIASTGEQWPVPMMMQPDKVDKVYLHVRGYVEPNDRRNSGIGRALRANDQTMSDPALEIEFKNGSYDRSTGAMGPSTISISILRPGPLERCMQ